MAKEEGIEVQGTIVEKHPGGIFDVKLDDEHLVLARIAGKLRKHRIRILTGDRRDGGIVTLRPHPRPHHLPFPFLALGWRRAAERGRWRVRAQAMVRCRSPLSRAVKLRN